MINRAVALSLEYVYLSRGMVVFIDGGALKNRVYTDYTHDQPRGVGFGRRCSCAARQCARSAVVLTRTVQPRHGSCADKSRMIFIGFSDFIRFLICREPLLLWSF